MDLLDLPLPPPPSTGRGSRRRKSTVRATQSRPAPRRALTAAERETELQRIAMQSDLAELLGHGDEAAAARQRAARVGDDAAQGSAAHDDHAGAAAARAGSLHRPRE